MSEKGILKVLEEEALKDFKVVYRKDGAICEVSLRKGRRLRRRWEVKQIDEGEVFVTHMPPLDMKEIQVMSIMSINGEPLLDPEESESEKESKEEDLLSREITVDNLEYWFADKMGPDQEKDFWDRQKAAPTLPETKAGRWQIQLREAKKQGGEDLSTMVKRGLANSTRANHRRILKWLEETETPGK